ncbi:MAG: ABC transporter substrate-binding protein [Candidatus Promineifilaceae bacterium]
MSLLVACSAEPVEVEVVVTKIVEREVMVEGETEQVEVVVTQIVEREVVVEVTGEPAPQSVDMNWPNLDWEQVLAEADGQTVNWYHWGGSDVWNNFMDVDIAAQALACCNVTINPVHISDTVEAVNKVLGEKEAGKDSGGSVDLIWINAENFITLRQPDLLFGPYAQALPNVQYIDTDSGYYNFDAGWPIAGYESLWGTSQMVIEYDSAVVNPPTSIPAFLEYICTDEARGLFTYPAPPDFIGTGLISTLLYNATGETDLWLGRGSQTSEPFAEKSPALWEQLNSIEECLWRNGETYPNDLAAQRDLVAQGEIAFSMNFGVGEIDNDIESGTYPETMRQMMFDEGTVGNAHYMSIPYNAANKAGAMVIANLLQAPANQLGLMRDVGSLPAVSYELLPADMQAEFDAYETSDARLPLDAFSPALPQLGDLQPKLEEGWRDNVLEQ